MSSPQSPIVGIIMGSVSDQPVMSKAADVLRRCSVPYEFKIVSAHRTPEQMFAYGQEAASRGLRVIIAGAGGAAHLPGMIAALTHLPVIGVPINCTSLQGLDALFSVCQMPEGTPVATMAVNGAYNAGLFATRILSLSDESIGKALITLIAEREQARLRDDQRLEETFKPTASH